MAFEIHTTISAEAVATAMHNDPSFGADVLVAFLSDPDAIDLAGHGFSTKSQASVFASYLRLLADNVEKTMAHAK